MVKSRHGIELPTKCGCQNFAMFVQSYFALPVLNNILQHIFIWKFYHCKCLHILEGDIVQMKKYDHDK